MNIKNSNSPVAENILRLINEAGIKQLVVAERAGFSAQTFNDMLNGRKLIKINDVKRIAEALRVTPNDLYGIPQIKAEAVTEPEELLVV